MFEEEKRNLVQRKNSIGLVEVSKDKLHSAVQSGFEKAKKERVLKRTKLIKRSSWSIVIAAILLISFITSVSVSPVFANKVASIPGMERIVGLIQQDRGLTAAVENDFYQPLNLSQEKNGMTVTLDGVIADKKGMVIFYSVQSKKKNQPLEIEYLKLMNEKYGNLPVYDTTFWGAEPPIIEEKVFSSMMTLETIENHIVGNSNLLWTIGLKNGNKVEQFQIPFKFTKSSVFSKTIDLNKEIMIEGQRIIVEKVTINPIRAEVKLKIDPNNSKKILSFDNLKFTNDIGDEWILNNNGTSFRSLDETEWTITLQSPYFNNSDNLKLVFGKIAAIDKDDDFILIDTESKNFLKQPAKSIFSNLEIENSKVSFIMDVNGEYNMLVSSSFLDNEGKEFFIKYDFTNPKPGEKYVNGLLMKTAEKGLKLEFELPKESIKNPLRFDLAYYPSWIEEDVEIEVK
ncbi:DUF4179 domain-containing protein [Paenisporosarcina indica]|uniref:DUF4179 domain-containing protein n=1 Tax=Paenisporosarcina indica TaxID=650093 RepID=UPI00094FA7D4|nr:DUF4179 domain-containing protein [Paenisporosarcina indica]